MLKNWFFSSLALSEAVEVELVLELDPELELVDAILVPVSDDRSVAVDICVMLAITLSSELLHSVEKGYCKNCAQLKFF